MCRLSIFRLAFIVLFSNVCSLAHGGVTLADVDRLQTQTLSASNVARDTLLIELFTRLESTDSYEVILEMNLLAADYFDPDRLRSGVAEKLLRTGKTLARESNDVLREFSFDIRLALLPCELAPTQCDSYSDLETTVEFFSVQHELLLRSADERQFVRHLFDVQRVMRNANVSYPAPLAVRITKSLREINSPTWANGSYSALVMQLLSQTHATLGDFESAKKMMAATKTLGKEVSPKLTAARTRWTQASIEHAKGAYVESQRMWSEALELAAESFAQKRVVSEMLVDASETDVALELWGDAEAKLTKAGLPSANGNRTYLVRGLLSLAAVKLSRGEFGDVRKYLDRSVEELQTMRVPPFALPRRLREIELLLAVETSDPQISQKIENLMSIARRGDVGFLSRLQAATDHLGGAEIEKRSAAVVRGGEIGALMASFENNRMLVMIASFVGIGVSGLTVAAFLLSRAKRHRAAARMSVRLELELSRLDDKEVERLGSVPLLLLAPNFGRASNVRYEIEPLFNSMLSIVRSSDRVGVVDGNSLAVVFCGESNESGRAAAVRVWRRFLEIDAPTSDTHIANVKAIQPLYAMLTNENKLSGSVSAMIADPQSYPLEFVNPSVEPGFETDQDSSQASNNPTASNASLSLSRARS